MRRRFALDLYFVTDRALCARLGLERVVGEAVAGGATLVQLRDDETPTAELVGIARGLKALLAGSGIPLLVNNRLDVALAVDADGAHVGQADAPPAAARARLGEGAILGLSIIDPAQLAGIDPGAVDYLGVGPIFTTATKADAAPAMGLAGLAAARAATTLPIIAIGGITEANTPTTIQAGADGIAVVSAIAASPDPRAAAARLARTVVEAKLRR